jgi:hypothetical protein
MNAVLIAWLLVVSPGNTALEAFRQGLTSEMAQTACKSGDLFACKSAAMARRDPGHLQAVMTQIVEDAQQACSANPQSSECDLLRELDRTATQVLEKHRYRRT